VFHFQEPSVGGQSFANHSGQCLSVIAFRSRPVLN
jgi:hypothetical protein